MNKIKVLYDVVKSLRNKETIDGVIDFEVTRGDERLVAFKNEFSRNNVSGEVIAKVSNEINAEGKRIKNETEAQFNSKECPFHGFHHSMHRNQLEHHGFKSKLSMAAFALNLLNNLKAEEKEDKTELSLDLKEVLKESKDLQAEFHKNHSEHEMNDNFKELHQHHHEFMKQLFSDEYQDASLNIIVNRDNEIERIVLSANGEKSINGTIVFNF